MNIPSQVRPFIFDLFTWSRDSIPFPVWALPIVWLGPAILAAWAASWLTGRRGTGFGRGAGIGVLAAVLVAVFGCVTPIVVLSPLVGAVVAIFAVLRSG
ncbi:MAG: hypothetical protein U0992_07915 [Planctomycetaceae bacterium]